MNRMPVQPELLRWARARAAWSAIKKTAYHWIDFFAEHRCFTARTGEPESQAATIP